MSVAAVDWQPVNVALAYRLGEIRLFSIDVAGVAFRRHFSRTDPFAQMPEPPSECDEQSFVFYPCYPVSFEPKPVTRVARWIAYTPYTFRNFFVDIKRIGSFDGYLKTFSSKSRSTLQRKVRKFAAASGGSIGWHRYRTAAEMDTFFRQAALLSTKTYQERLLASGLPQDAGFKNRASQLGANGGATGFLLFLHDKPVAYVFSFCADGIMTYDYVGYDPDEASLSPGTVLQYLILESLFAEGQVDIFDFTEGEGQQKALFGTDHRLCATTYFFQRSVKNAGLVWTHRSLNDLVQATGAGLERLRLKSAIRRLIRKAA